ncbi:hypothetical protein GLOIN_2v961500 [Rhizophagus irregularis DAOM 181602=DAOM 197198]|uniref:Uncharacterized protein n=1 Tax=Rhizophagus irregularis (strain DAOM 181602 / DAOM 197198 / MUCL 43194) TaxID=747089 RepID=A0A2P4NXT8_RHIID|nr:hypothetical protein GLOIN_2v961500 [Rhizophagus irregularis DAOM 181602=DAOM 197198]POG57962.1 hypothetical protein GLOIN_2v961500 [Rhizophagus irregularis DAOM 181602=DAOM 197198]GET55301.1 hypothetical protein GLOIN_2v961500 [Rhizophagus irregularis DAOM 181602=DAOM 197198]|eukprot:XP_025164828.1 hypothetical protein GLOIN_2v961500 [Rhizophagus irregularis DAOM 181602=DAOM 197198]
MICVIIFFYNCDNFFYYNNEYNEYNMKRWKFSHSLTFLTHYSLFSLLFFPIHLFFHSSNSLSHFFFFISINYFISFFISFFRLQSFLSSFNSF